MKNVQLLFIGIITSLFIISCKEKSYDMEIESGKPIASLEDYFGFLNSPADGSIIIQSFETNASNGQSFMITSSFSGDRPPFDIKVNNTEVNFESHYFNSSTNKSSSVFNSADMHELYGNDFEIVFETNLTVLKNTTSDSNSTASVYIPDLIHVQFSELQEGKIVVGSVVSWNFDGDNENGVVLAFEYSPSSQYDEEVSTQYPNDILDGVSLPDNGMYVITASDMQYLPDNALISVYVGRAGYTITTGSGGDGTYSIAGYTVSRNDFIIQK